MASPLKKRDFFHRTKHVDILLSVGPTPIIRMLDDQFNSREFSKPMFSKDTIVIIISLSVIHRQRTGKALQI
ncbi:hypothetical protein BK671_14580 [Pseudomonas fluorescens]|uniref:Uncharacterized protein n=1 Tax=Pseudomonas fluorescens TaxID=294 RepID=A0A423LFX9_PSEFL|nr:hypothetical protein BK671_14580 [Pseudomonas fluorescens]